MRKPSTPRSNQNRSTSRNSWCTTGFSQFRSGCSGAYRCRYHSPSGTRLQAEPPNRDCQSLGGSGLAGRNQNISRCGEPGPAATASRNQRCRSEQWLGTMSMITFRPRECASSMNFSASASVPNDGSMSR